MKNVPYIVGSQSVSFFFEGQPFEITGSHPNYSKIIKKLSTKDTADLLDLIDIPKAITTQSNGKIVVRDGAVFYNGEALHNHAAERLVALLEGGHDINPLVKFLERLMSNPSKRVVDDLFKFLDYKKMPLDPDDGCFYAYKAVRGDWMDKHSGTIRNMIGDKPEVPRNKVDDRHEVDCSHGLHVGTLEYVSSFKGSGDHVVIVKVDPADVVTVPAYDVTKLRCCRYEVVAEYDGPLPNNIYGRPETITDYSYLDDEDDEYDDEEFWDDDEDLDEDEEEGREWCAACGEYHYC